ncbi:MAG TPA: ATP-binding cassette domain-containing protein [Vicinamibacterales bacterium]|jgi:predicted ABC-type transport system involved in lysophospholipase L1 biosynthesis ATPase subunit|nr:ATP-binding cassette domain-containing protein [Vicinamibacterales bacterium]
MTGDNLLIEITGVTKDYHGLRPLRVEHLQIGAGESVALLGVDAAMAEVLVSLITGAQLPDEGEVRLFGRPTKSITGVDEWVKELDRFGLISARAVLVDQFTTEQNLALPLSLEIEPLPPDIRAQVGQLASEVGLTNEELGAITAVLSPGAQLRLRVGRALALRPEVLIAEHPNALLPGNESLRFAADFARIAAGRAIAALVMTADPAFAAVIAKRVLEFQPATGRLVEKQSGWRRWFS